ncbi:MAG: DUF420 domain-containing protein, partial [Terriglobales bacterium]
SLPLLTAVLNGLAAILLLTGFILVRRHRLHGHRRAMLGAFAASCLFLVVYVLHHWHSGLVYYQGTGWRRGLYFTILGTHTPLAAVIPVLALITLSFAWRGRFTRHRQWARWTLPIWLYVSVTGIAVYWMLYR